MRSALPPLVLPLLTALAGCATFPDLDAAISEEAKAADKPYLADNQPLLARADTLTIDDSTQAVLQARADGLKSRADGLAGPVMTQAEADALLLRQARLRDEAARVAPDS